MLAPAPYHNSDSAVPDWRGLYLGATLGAAFHGDDVIGVRPPSGALENIGTFHHSGFSGTLLAGYRIQSGSWVLGPEVSASVGNIGDDFSDAASSGKTTREHAIDLRIKAGKVIGEAQDTLIFALAGVSQAHFDYAIAAPLTAGSVALDDSFSSTGYVLGLGAEKKLTNRLALTGAVEYSNYGKTELRDTAGNVTLATPEFYTAKIGFSYDF